MQGGGWRTRMGSEPALDVTSLGLRDGLAAEHSEECCGKQCVAMVTKKINCLCISF